MKQAHMGKRFLLPLMLVIVVRQLSIFLYHTASTLPAGLYRNILIETFGPLGFISLWFFAWVGPPLAYYLGATFGERFFIAFANPVIWIAGIESKIACQFSAIEMIYFLFLPWIFGIMCVTCVAFSLSELICRIIHRWQTRDPVKVLSPTVLILLTGGAVGTYTGLIKGQEWVYMVVHHYARFFME
jgi:hypothetical protein